MTDSVLTFIRSAFLSVISLMQNATVVDVTLSGNHYSLTLFDLILSAMVFGLVVSVITHFSGRDDNG